MADPALALAPPPPQNDDEHYYCTDAESIRGLIKTVAVKERERVLGLLGADYASRFNTVGFCQRRPVQILSPYAFEPGPERRVFLEELAAVSS